ncbi:hypothetical protein B0T18DRAFT_468744 [Schizothecium vesticola]|uniref:Integral membrane protein n=1 Tax=Schizothecium vesticola TaxID=314040 RepID=A0AA40K2C6_9PEZI|nr:hypothetical protein B0T18DRAFT_468744 [Schizothecium vesticola]
MPGTLVPPWWTQAEPQQSAVILASFCWGFTMALAVFCCTKAFSQTNRAWRRSHHLGTYIIMVWLLATANIVVAPLLSGLRQLIPSSFWYLFFMLCLWTIEVQCLTQIMVNRISLLLYKPAEIRRLKISVAVIIAIINVTVFIVWIPARLQISTLWIRANAVWDRIEKCLFLLVDLALNVKFMWLIKSQLIAQGLTQYKRVYRFNLLMVGVSISLDVAIIALMSLPEDCVYIQVHALAYMVKLYIEMNLAELMGKVIKKSNRNRNECVAMDGWHPDQGRRAGEERMTAALVGQPGKADLHSNAEEEEKDIGTVGASLDEEETWEAYSRSEPNK